jgi:drug/metabolite transporter (DMT)-like permease
VIRPLSRGVARPAGRPDLWPLAAIAVTLLAWASAFVAIRRVGAEISPGALTLGRLIIGVLCLGVALLRAGWVRPTRREWLLVAGCGVAWLALYNVSLNAAERHVDAGTAAMLLNVGPILVAILAGVFLGEGIPAWLIAGAFVALCGVALIGLGGPGGGTVDTSGVLLCLVAAGAYACGVVLQKVALRRLPALQITWIACATGALVCLPFAGQLKRDLAAASLESALGVVYLGAVPTALAFTTWAYALARSDAGRLGATTYIVPPIAILIAWLLLGEAPLPLQLVGGAICLAGVALSRIRPAIRR